MRTHFQRPARAGLWTAAAFIGLFAVLGFAAIAPSTPGARDATPEGESPATARLSAVGQSRLRCPECGTVESIRQVGRDGADGAAGNGYEITVRLRDGSRTVLSEARPGSWRRGSRVLVIGSAAGAKN